MKEANKITEGALLTAVYIVLLLVVIFIPFILMIGLFVLPIPFIIYATRYSYRPALVMFLVASALTLLFATVVSLPMTLLSGIGGIVIGTALHKGRKPYEVWARGTIGFIVAMLAIIFLMQFVLDINIYQETETIIEESLTMTKSMMETFNFNVEQMEEFSIVEDQMRMFPDLLPASIAIMSIFLALGSIWFSFKIMNRIENKRYAFPPFRQFSLPKAIIWIYFVTIIISFFITETDETGYITILNITMLIITLLTIQGFSFIFFYADVKRWHQSIPFIIVIVSFLIPFISMLIIRIIGIIDLGFDLKGKVAQANEK